MRVCVSWSRVLELVEEVSGLEWVVRVQILSRGGLSGSWLTGSPIGFSFVIYRCHYCSFGCLLIRLE